MVRYRNLNSPIECFKIDKSQVSMITPVIFQEHIIRVFVKDPAKYNIVE